ncbi:ABC transporter ATP-binding protein [uncultured Flavonifractor sp.]|uniref:ABC transporter ATP-binding protein n=1 Tax=uncultured Flavonifractor sp. TaxID=1193534 RepID=UPI00263202A7|nr:ABC transporter ATP-binding protein [uncultured Flavonifractor sp.]
MELKIQDLCVRFSTPSGEIPAVNHVSLTFSPDTVTGIIGETGSGKSVLGLSILGLLQSNAAVSGQIFLGKRELTALSQRELCQVQGRDIALVAQNPATSLNPSLRVGRQIEEVFRLRGENRAQRRAHTLELLRSMAFSDPERVARSYPFELSGGMCQRALTAIAVAARPRWLIADEPTKGLDAVVRNQVYDTFRTVREQYRAGFLVITHDLLLARKFCDRIVVMYCGRILETNTARELFEHPRHPYTQGLIASLPHLGMRPMAGFSPAFTHQPAGCVFHPRCPHARERCRLEEPGELCLGEGRVACHGCT